MRRTILTILAAFALAGCRTAPPAPAAPPLWDLRIDPLIDLHSWARMLVFRPDERPGLPGLSEAIEALQQQGDSRAWGIYDGSMIEASNAADLARIAAELPENVQSRSGQSIPMRERMTRLAQAYQKLEPPFRETLWPRHRERAERVAAYLRRHLLPRSAEVFADLARSLDVSVPSTPIPVYLVAEAPFPRAVTSRSPAGPFSVVAPEGEPNNLWDEIVIHETIHGLDVLSREGGALRELRRRLSAVPGASPQEVEEHAHCLMFVQAAGTVRRVFDPAHKDYGDVAGVYGRLPKASPVVVPAWKDYLAGKIFRAAALDRIVQAYQKEKGAPQDALSRVGMP